MKKDWAFFVLIICAITVLTEAGHKPRARRSPITIHSVKILMDANRWWLPILEPIDNPGVCQANEVYACGSACQTTCATFNQTCPIVNIRCNDACYCIDGYARDNNDICIPDNSYECERLKPGNCHREHLMKTYVKPIVTLFLGKCPKNEFYSCGSACQTTCETFNQTCPIVNIKCNEGYYCIDGYARNRAGVCIPDNSLECENLKPSNCH